MSLEVAIQELNANILALIPVMRAIVTGTATVGAADDAKPEKPIAKQIEEAGEATAKTIAKAAPKEEPTGPLTYADVQPLALKVMNTISRDALVKVLAGFGLKRAQEAQPDQLPALKAALEAVIAEHEASK